MTDQSKTNPVSESKYPFHIYGYKNNFKIGDTNLGALANRLCRLVEDAKDKKHGEEFDVPEVFDAVDKFMDSLSSLFYVGAHNSLEVQLAESMFMDRSFRARSWKSSFTLDSRNLKSNEQVKAFIVALVSAMDEKVMYLKEKKYGRKFTHESKFTDPETKKPVIKSEETDTRNFNGLVSAGTIHVFDVLDKVSNDSYNLLKYVEELFASTISKYNTKFEENKDNKGNKGNKYNQKGDKPKGKPSKYGNNKNKDKYNKHKKKEEDWGRNSKTTNSNDENNKVKKEENKTVIIQSK